MEDTMQVEEMPQLLVEIEEDLITISQTETDSASNAFVNSVTIIPEQIPWLVGRLFEAGSKIMADRMSNKVLSEK
jgi:hypothetical protein